MNPPDLYARLAAAGQLPRRSEFPAWSDSGAPVMLYGAGGVGRDVLGLLTGRGIGVRCFLDANVAPGTHLNGVPVRRPDDPEWDDATRRNTPVIVTIFNPDVDLGAVQAHLRGIGWSTVVTFPELHRFYAASLGDRYWLTDVSFYADRAPQMRAGAALWADERSRALYDAVLRCRLEGDVRQLPAPETGSDYFPTDVPPWSTPMRFVDCGAFDGDTLEDVCRRGLEVEALAAFEPEMANVRRLFARLAPLTSGNGGPQLLFWPCAVSSRTTRLRFASGQGAGSGLSTTGGDVVQAVSLDEALPSFRPTLVKMDIEGAEHDALLGARELIRRCRPGLAVCAYHRPEHLWLIPQLIQGWDLGYRLYLRLHRHNGFDLVCYAHPLMN